MNSTDDGRDIALPVTNEIGSEGGSYADPTLQVATFDEPQKDERAPGIGGAGSAAGHAIRREEIARPADDHPGLRRYPTEPPNGAAPSRPPRLLSPGLVGAAAGLAIGLLAARRRD